MATGFFTGTALASLFSSGGIIFAAVLTFFGLFIRIPELAILGFILMLVMINSIFGLPTWFIIISIIVLGIWLLNSISRSK